MSTRQKPPFGKRLNEKGLEVLSKVKAAVQIKLRRPVSEHQRFRQYLDQQSKLASMAGEDTYEEFIDFGPEEDFTGPNSPYELVYDPRTGKEVLPAEKIWLDQQRAAFDAAEAEKRKQARLARQQSPAPDDYVTPAPTAPKNSRKAQLQPQNDDGE